MEHPSHGQIAHHVTETSEEILRLLQQRGFPPDEMSGVLVVTQELARVVERRHRTTVEAAAAAAPA